MEFLFEQSPWEAYLNTRRPGDTVSVSNLLTMLEGEDDMTVEDALALIDEQGLVLDVSAFPKAAGTGQAAVRLRREEELAKNGLNAEALEENDPLRLYLEELAQIPACGDEELLARKLAAGDGNVDIPLTNLGLSRVVELAKEHTGWGVLLLDLIQEGSLGLWQGISCFEGGSYADHRDRWIRNAMAKAILLQARSNGVGQKLHTAMQDYRSVDERLLSELGRNPGIEEIAVELHMSVEEAQTIKKMLSDAYLLQQAENAAQPKQEEPEDEQAVEDTAYFQMRQRIEELLSGLSKQDAKILTLRFGLEKGLPLSAEETARKLGMTPEEVSRREAAALMKLRN